MMFYSFTYGNGKCDACLIYIDGLTDNQLLAEYIISPVQAAARHQEEPAETPPSSISFGYRHTRLSSLKDAEADIFSGKSVLLAEGWEEALSFETETFKMRDIEEPASEVLERGPRIGFVEKLRRTRRFCASSPVIPTSRSKRSHSANGQKADRRCLHSGYCP